MQSHKEKVKAIEQKLMWLNPNLNGIIYIKESKISGQSTTASLMQKMPMISFVIWCVCSALLLTKQLGFFS